MKTFFFNENIFHVIDFGMFAKPFSEKKDFSFNMKPRFTVTKDTLIKTKQKKKSVSADCEKEFRCKLSSHFVGQIKQKKDKEKEMFPLCYNQSLTISD